MRRMGEEEEEEEEGVICAATISGCVYWGVGQLLMPYGERMGSDKDWNGPGP